MADSLEELFGRRLLEDVIPEIELTATQLLNDLDIVASQQLIQNVEGGIDENNDIRLFFPEYGVIQDEGLKGRDGVVDSPFRAAPLVGTARNGFQFTRNNSSTIERGSGTIGISIVAIRRWLDHRNVPRFLANREREAFVIARSIVNTGFEGRPWILRVLDSDETQELITDALESAITDRLEATLEARGINIT